MTRKPHAPGYTLAEMIVVLVILGLAAVGMAVLGTAAYGAMHRTRFEAECAEIQSAFADLRNQALMSGSPYGAYAQILEDKIILTHYRGDNGAKITRTLPLQSIRIQSRQHRPISVVNLSFTASGTISRGTTLSLNGPGRLQCYLIFQPVTGRIYLSQTPPSP
jgi:prepilin-type N-terminal cleavage/methylation domain-containing protein